MLPRICKNCGSENLSARGVCRPCRSAYMRKWNQRPEHREKILARHRSEYYRRKDAGIPRNLSEAARQAARERTKAWVKANPEKAAAAERRKRQGGRNQRIAQARKNRFPAWANIKHINAVYKTAQRLTCRTGERYVVDHIIPLNGRIVSGLHVEDNLQVLHWRENLLKSNAFERSYF